MQVISNACIGIMPIRGELIIQQASFPRKREPRKILKQTFSGSRILRKAKLTQSFSKFRDDAVGVIVGMVGCEE